MTRVLVAAFTLALGACTSAAKRPPRWTEQPTWRPALRAVASGEVAEGFQSQTSYLGASVGVGAEARFDIHPELNRRFYGEAMGLELRGRLLEPVDGPDQRRIGQLGLAYTSSIVWKGSSPLGRLRVPAPFALLAPEVGLTFRSDERPVPTLRFAAPVAVLVERHLAVELTPSATMIGLTPRAHPELQVGLGLGLSVRQIRERRYEDAGFGVWSSTAPLCRGRPWWRPPEIAHPLDLTPALPYRRYLAITRVTPMSRYFRVGSPYVDERTAVVRATELPSGKLELEFEPESLGSFATEPGHTEPVPASLARLAEAVRAHVRNQCGASGRIDVAYAGAHRSVVLEEFVLPARVSGHGPVLAWQATHVIAMDETLGSVLRTEDPSGRRARIQIPSGARFLPSSGMPAWKVDAPSELPNGLHAEIAQVARRFDLGLPTTPLASLIPPEQAGIPRSLDPHLRMTVVIDVPIPGAPTSRSQEVVVSLALHDAVFGPEAKGEGSLSLGSGDFRVRAVLAPSDPRRPVAGAHHERFQGSLVLEVVHESGGRFEGWFPVSGELELDGEGVLAPAGLRITSPAKDGAPRTGKLPLGGGRSANVIVLGKLPQLESE